jgi:hypothetical protein
MNRIKQISKATEEFAQGPWKSQTEVATAFRCGAQWADRTKDTVKLKDLIISLSEMIEELTQHKEYLKDMLNEINTRD